MRVYLCGAINGKSDEECRSWREEAKRIALFECVDPMNRDYRGKEDDNYFEIVESDKEDIRSCDALLINANSPSWGTAMEIVYAYGYAVPCYIFTSGRVSPWLRYHAATISPDLGMAIYEINKAFGLPL